MSVYESDIRDYNNPTKRRKLALFKTIRIALIRMKKLINDTSDDKLIKSYFGNLQIVFMTKQEYNNAVGHDPHSLDGKAVVSISAGKVAEETYVDIHQSG